MHLEWDIALWMLPVIVVAAASIGIGSKIRERYPRSRVGRVVGSTVFGIGLVGFGLGALAIIANLLAPIGVAAYCVVADCEAANAEARNQTPRLSKLNNSVSAFGINSAHGKREWPLLCRRMRTPQDRCQAPN
jgi:hypothetical protein